MISIEVDVQRKKQKSIGKKTSNKFDRGEDDAKTVPSILKAKRKRDRKLEKAARSGARKRNLGLRSDSLEGD